MKPAAVFRTNAGLPIKESHFSLGSGPPLAGAVGSADVFSVRAIIRFLVDGLHDLREGKVRLRRVVRPVAGRPGPVRPGANGVARTTQFERRLFGIGTRVRCRASAAHVKQTPMCAKPRIGRACRRLRMSLSGLWLHHGLRGGCAAREPEAVAGATPLFGMPHTARRRLGCARQSHPRLGVACLYQSCRFPRDLHDRVTGKARAAESPQRGA